MSEGDLSQRAKKLWAQLTPEQLSDVTVLMSDARQEGWKAGMEEAAKLVEKFFEPGVDDPAYAVVQVDQITQAIRDRIHTKTL